MIIDVGSIVLAKGRYFEVTGIKFIDICKIDVVELNINEDEITIDTNDIVLVWDLQNKKEDDDDYEEDFGYYPIY